MARDFYLVAYDISDPARLQQALNLLKGYSTGGQKSVFECFLTSGEKGQIQRAIQQIIDPEEDRAHIFALDGRSRIHTLGIAMRPKIPDFFYFG